MVSSSFAARAVGLITNHTGRSKDGIATIDLLHKAPGVTLVALFSPEHGIRGVLDSDVPAEKDEKTGLHDSLAVLQRRHRPSARGIARRDRHARDRSAGHRRAVLHLSARDGLRDGGSREAEDRGRRPRSPESDQRLADRRPAVARARPGRVAEHVHRLSADADSPRHDDGRVGAALQRGEEDQRRPDGDRPRELEARRLVRRNRPGVDQPVAEHAQHEPGDALSGHWRDRVLEHLGRPRHRSAVRANRRAVDQRAAARRSAERAALAGHPFLSDHLHAAVEQVREGGMPGRVHGGDQSRGAAAGARGDRNRERVVFAIRSEVRAEQHVAIDWFRADRGSDQEWRGSRRDRGVVHGREARWRRLRAKYLLYR